MFSIAYVILPLAGTAPAEAIRTSLAPFQRGGRNGPGSVPHRFHHPPGTPSRDGRLWALAQPVGARGFQDRLQKAFLRSIARQIGAIPVLHGIPA